MSLWDKILIFFGLKKRPRPTPPVALRAVAVTVFSNGRPVPNAEVKLDQNPQPYVGRTNGDGYVLFPEVPVTLMASHLLVTADGFKEYSHHVDLNTVNHTIRVGEQKRVDEDIELPELERAGFSHGKRTGIVRAVGHHFADDQGIFLPLGATLFWALRGWKDDRARIQQNILWLAQQGFDYYRVLAQVGWTGLETDPRWPGYAQMLAELIDWSYDVAGIRVQITGIGGGMKGLYSPDALINTIIDVVRPRAHKVIFLEVANEWYGNFEDENKLKELGRRMKDALPNLVALSAPKEELAWDRSKKWIQGGYADMTTAHFDRSDNAGDWKWRHVRKPWESRGVSVPSSHNEPGGPRSSVAQYEEAIHLVMSRAVGILCGYDAYVLHNSAGIFGVPRPDHGGRPANVWEIPGIENTNAVVRNLDSILPADASEGEPTRKGLGPHPLTADINWPDGGDHGIVRDYALVKGDGTFWQTLFGIKNYVNVKSNGNYALELIDPVTRTVETRRVSNGETIRIEPRSRDSRGLGAILVKGRRV